MTTATAGKPDGKKLFKDHEPEIVALYSRFLYSSRWVHYSPRLCLDWLVFAGWDFPIGPFVRYDLPVWKLLCLLYATAFCLVYRSFGEK